MQTNFVALMTAQLDPTHVVPHRMFIPGTKLVPVTVSVKEAPPAAAELGLRRAITGAGGATVKVAGADVPWFVVTVTLVVPAVATRLAGTCAASVPPAMRVVASGVAPKLTTEAEVKFWPTTLIANAAAPAVTLLGVTLVMAGSAGLMVKARPDEVPLLVTTVMLTEPGLAIRLAGTAAKSAVELTKVVVSAVEFQ